MMSFEQLRTHYPDHVPAAFKVHVIKEYLQTLLLNRLSKSGFAKELVFIGGTSLRFCHGLDRFSEDLDFDYFGADRELLRDSFDAIAGHVSNEGLLCSTAHDYRNSDNFCKMQFPDISKTYGLDDPRKKIWVKIDIQKNKTPYEKQLHYVNRFGHFFPVYLPVINVLLSMKAIVLTQRAKARDMYDFSFLCQRAKIDFSYLKQEMAQRGFHVSTPGKLKQMILFTVEKADMREKEHEISLFLINRENAVRVSSFYDYVSGLDFDALCAI